MSGLLEEVRSRAWAAVCEQPSWIGWVLLKCDRVRARPLMTIFGPNIQKDLDRQPIGATLNLPQEAP